MFYVSYATRKGACWHAFWASLRQWDHRAVELVFLAGLKIWLDLAVWRLFDGSGLF